MVVTILLSLCCSICKAPATEETAFTFKDKFEIPTQNSAISFAANGTYEDALNILRNEAAASEANYVRMDQQIVSTVSHPAFVIYGVGYFCPWESLP